MSTQSDLIDYFKLNAVYDPDTNSTREVIQTSDRIQLNDRFFPRKNGGDQLNALVVEHLAMYG